MTTVSDPNVDVAERAWAVVTIRVAWTLYAQGIRLRPELLRDARDNVWMHLEPSTLNELAEDRAERLTKEYIARARRKSLNDPWPQDRTIPLLLGWREELHQTQRSAQALVREYHYGDGHRLSDIAKAANTDPRALGAAREGLRERLRRAAQADGVNFEGWPDARLDTLLARLSALPPDPHPPLTEVADGLHQEVHPHCIRSRRAYELVRKRLISRGELIPPPTNARPKDRVVVLALHFHPDGRHHRGAIVSEFNGAAFPVGEEHLVLDASNLAELHRTLQLAAEVATPRKHHLRGRLLEGEGRFSRHGLLGPMVEEITLATRPLSWGELVGLKELPEPLPPPPSAWKWWLAVAALCLFAIGLGRAVLKESSPPAAHPLAVQFSPGRGGLWLDFDVDDEAQVVIARLHDGKIELLLDSAHISDKMVFATGDGRFRLHSEGQGLLIASSHFPLDNLPELLVAAQDTPAPLSALREAIKSSHPSSDIYVEEL